MKLLRCFAVGILILIGCAKEEETIPVSETPTPLNPPIQQYDGTMSFTLDGVQHTIGVSAQSNGYVPGEIVILGYVPQSENELMLTFNPGRGSSLTINASMTGYWDLALCTPRNKYVLRPDSLNHVAVTAYDSSLTGRFAFIFQYEKDTTKIVKFLDGTFSVKVDTVYPFKYCIEG
jgi:hypothetical protein